MSASRLNMKHGFIRYITKCQNDRDKYDKEVKAKAAQAAETKIPRQGGTHHNKHRKPDQQTYIPPTRHRAVPNGNSSETTECQQEDILFRLEFEDMHGQIVDLKILPNDDPVMISRRFGKERGFTPSMVAAFTDFIRLEMRAVGQWGGEAS